MVHTFQREASWSLPFLVITALLAIFVFIVVIIISCTPQTQRGEIKQHYKGKEQNEPALISMEQNEPVLTSTDLTNTDSILQTGRVGETMLLWELTSSIVKSFSNNNILTIPIDIKYSNEFNVRNGIMTYTGHKKVKVILFLHVHVLGVSSFIPSISQSLNSSTSSTSSTSPTTPNSHNSSLNLPTLLESTNNIDLTNSTDSTDFTDSSDSTTLTTSTTSVTNSISSQKETLSHSIHIFHKQQPRRSILWDAKEKTMGYVILDLKPSTMFAIQQEFQTDQTSIFDACYFKLQCSIKTFRNK